MSKPTRRPSAASTGVSKPRRTAPKRKPRTASGTSREDPYVAEFLRTSEHPLKSAAVALRQAILDADTAIEEGIKWNSPSFKTSVFFATINLHARDEVRLILHTGAKKKVKAKPGARIADPQQLLKWPAEDRCIVTIRDLKDVRQKSVALQAIVREWIRHM